MKVITFLFLITSLSLSSQQIVLLHGYNSNSYSLQNLDESLGKKNLLIDAPFEVFEGNYKWFSLNTQKLGLVTIEEAKFSLEYLKGRLKDFKNIILIGYSQGGVMAGALALSSEKFNRVILLNSYLDESFFSKRKKLKDLEILLIYDDEDYVLGKERISMTIDILKRNKINYKVFKHSNFHQYRHSEIQKIIQKIEKWKHKKKNLLK